jgi:hypothetical protein
MRVVSSAASATRGPPRADAAAYTPTRLVTTTAATSAARIRGPRVGEGTGGGSGVNRRSGRSSASSNSSADENRSTARFAMHRATTRITPSGTELRYTRRSRGSAVMT